MKNSQIPNGAASDRAPLVYNGEVIHQRDEMLSLTDMWKAAKSDPSRRPVDWTRQKASIEFVEHVALVVGVAHCDLIVTHNGGRSTGTWAHWQVGLAYAKYLSPEFHMWCNTVVRERMMGKAHDAHFPADVLEMFRRTDGICRMLSHKVTEMEKVQVAMAANVTASTAALSAIASVVQPPHSILVRHGRTAGQIWRDNKLPPMKNIASWFGNLLSKAGCRVVDNGCAEMGLTKARLFDPDKAQAWLDELGGQSVVDRKIAERRGQMKIHLVTPAAEAGRAL